MSSSQKSYVTEYTPSIIDFFCFLIASSSLCGTIISDYTHTGPFITRRSLPLVMILALINSIIIIITPILSNNLIWYFCKETEHISPEQPYRLNPENRAQNTRDSSGDIPFEPNHISPCISPKENAINRAQNEQLRRSGDTGDICL